MAKGGEASIAKRKLLILEKLAKRKGQPVTFDELADLCQAKFGIHDVSTIKRDVKELASIRIPLNVTSKDVVFASMGLSKLCEGTPVANRLSGDEPTKQLLAKQMVHFLKSIKEKKIEKILVGTGVTCYETVKEIIIHNAELKIETIFTTNLLVLYEFMLRKPADGIEIQMPPGIFNSPTFSLLNQECISYLQNIKAHAVITSFNGLTQEGFTTGKEQEVSEKIMNLLPHSQCNYVLIPLELEKVGHEGKPVKKNFKAGIELLDFQEGRRRYIIFTNIPIQILEEQRSEQSKILQFWKKKGIEIVSIKESTKG